MAFTAPTAHEVPSATRPATVRERLVYDHAAWHLRSIGVPIPDFTVDVTPDVAECGAADPSVVYACAGEGRVFLSIAAAADARRYYRSASHTRRATRAVSLSRCADICLDTAEVALHELVHVARFTAHPLNTWVRTDIPFEEGLAEAVATDQVGPMVFRVSGLRGAATVSYSYEAWTEMVFAATGGETFGRRNRLNAVMTPSVIFSMDPEVGL